MPKQVSHHSRGRWQDELVGLEVWGIRWNDATRFTTILRSLLASDQDPQSLPGLFLVDLFHARRLLVTPYRACPLQGFIK